jgi:hypothetical protein
MEGCAIGKVLHGCENFGEFLKSRAIPGELRTADGGPWHAIGRGDASSRRRQTKLNIRGLGQEMISQTARWLFSETRRFASLLPFVCKAGSDFSAKKVAELDAAT